MIPVYNLGITGYWSVQLKRIPSPQLKEGYHEVFGLLAQTYSTEQNQRLDVCIIGATRPQLEALEILLHEALHTDWLTREQDPLPFLRSRDA